MKILVTGGAGFIGAALCRSLAVEGHEVVAADNLNDYYPTVLKTARLEYNGIRAEGGASGMTASSLFPNLSFVKVSIEDRDSMDRLFSAGKFDKVVNLAAQAGVRYSTEAPFEYIQSNVTGFLTVLECCRKYGVGHLVFASSSSVYGRATKVPFSEDDRTDCPVSLYAATKKADEVMAYAYHSLYGIRMTGIRFFTVYGPWGRPDMAPFIFADAITGGKTLRIFNGGRHVRDFTYIDDVVEATVRIVGDRRVSSGTDEGFEIFNVGGGAPAALTDFISEMENVFGKTAEKEYLPMQQGDVTRTFADASRLEACYGFRPSVPLKTGLEKFASWYLSPDNPLKPKGIFRINPAN